VQPDDPTFVLRRAVSYRHASRNRTSAPLDEIALQQLHRESALSQSSAASDATATPGDDAKQRQTSKQDIVPGQRAAQRASQRTILSTHSNSFHGVDVVLLGNAMLRSSRYDDDDRIRYSYVEADGETYDISYIVEEEWREGESHDGKDLLEGAVSQDKGGLGDRVDRIINKVKDGKPFMRDSRISMRSATSEYSAESPTSAHHTGSKDSHTSERANRLVAQRAVSPGSMLQKGASPAIRPTPEGQQTRSWTSTPTGISSGTASQEPRQNSVASNSLEMSGYSTTSSGPFSGSSLGSSGPSTPSSRRNKRVVIPKDDFGVAHMLAIIEFSGRGVNVPPPPPPDPVDEMLFGRPIDWASLHPQIRDIYAGTFKQLEDMDKVCWHLSLFLSCG